MVSTVTPLRNIYLESFCNLSFQLNEIDNSPTEVVPRMSSDQNPSDIPMKYWLVKAGSLYWLIIIPMCLGSVIPYIP